MKFSVKYLLIYLILLYNCDISFQIKSTNIKRNGFRVLMNKGYIDNISEFLMAFLKSSKIQQNVGSLILCISN